MYDNLKVADELAKQVNDHLSISGESIDSILPSGDDIQLYLKNGFYISKALFPTSLIEDANFGVARYYAGERDYVLPIQGGFLDWRKEFGHTLRINDYVSLQSEHLRKFVQWPLLGAVAARLAQAHGVRLFHDQLITKPSHGNSSTAVGWHIDRSYWNTCSSDSMLTAWIPLVPYELDMGPLMIIEGSHRWTGNEWMNTFNVHELDQLENQIVTHGNLLQKKPILISPGQVSFHHCRLIHGSFPNKGSKPRVTLTVHFQDLANFYVLHSDILGKKSIHINDLLCRKLPDGRPDYADPEICPIIWDQATDYQLRLLWEAEHVK